MLVNVMGIQITQLIGLQVLSFTILLCITHTTNINIYGKNCKIGCFDLVMNCKFREFGFGFWVLVLRFRGFVGIEATLVAKYVAHTQRRWWIEGSGGEIGATGFVFLLRM